MTQARIDVITFSDWRSSLALIVGVVAGYINLKFGMKAFFVINDKDTPLVLTVILGYVALLPLTIVGFFYTRQASIILLIVTAVAFACGKTGGRTGKLGDGREVYRRELCLKLR
jgi:hypothetical protein